MIRHRIPKYIYLQWHGDAPEGETGPVDTQDVTWHTKRIFDRDVRYVRDTVSLTEETEQEVEA